MDLTLTLRMGRFKQLLLVSVPKSKIGVVAGILLNLDQFLIKIDTNAFYLLLTLLILALEELYFLILVPPLEIFNLQLVSELELLLPQLLDFVLQLADIVLLQGY